MFEEPELRFQRLREFALTHPISRANGVMTEHYVTLKHTGVTIALSLNK